MSIRHSIRLRSPRRARLAILLPVLFSLVLGSIAMTYRSSQSMLIGAMGERNAEDEMHPGLYRSETAYLRDLRAEAAHDASVFSLLMAVSSGLMLVAMLIGVANFNGKVRVAETVAPPQA